MPAAKRIEGVPVQFGGPVQTGRGFVLHSADYSGGDSTVKIGQAAGLQLGLTATVDVVKAIADGRGPKASMLALGYAGGAAVLPELQALLLDPTPPVQLAAAKAILAATAGR